MNDNIDVDENGFPMASRRFQSRFKKCIVFTCCCSMIIFIGLFIYLSIKYFEK